MRYQFIGLLAPLICLTLVACLGANEITVIDAWARPALKGDNSAVYFRVNNPAMQADALVGAEAEVAEKSEIHLSEMDSEGVMSMHHQPQVDIPANTQTDFAPGGLHVMLVGLNEELGVGDTLRITLKFKNAGDITLDVPVKQQ